MIASFARCFLVMACLGLAGCSEEVEGLPDAGTSAIKQAVRERLRDPESAKFSHLVAKKDEKGMYVVCGLVNAKNGYGGYSGDLIFKAWAVQLGANEWSVSLAGGNGTSGEQGRRCAEDGLIPQ